MLPVIGLVQGQRKVSYDDIAETIYASCTPCHSPGGPAPFYLRNYEEVQRRSERVGLDVISSAMPPCQVRSDFGRFPSTPGLTTEQMIRIRSWANDGAPPGERNPVAPQIGARVWRLGKPHLLVRSGPVSAPSEGGIHWVFAKVKLTRGGVIRGMELKPSDPQTIRQATVGWARPGIDAVADTTTLPEGVEPIGSWAFGYYTWRSPRGTGVLIPAGSDLHLMLQCQAIGKEGDASFDLALYFEDDTPLHVERIVMEKRGFTIQNGEKLRLDLSTTLDADLRVTSLLPEFRYACEQVDLTAVLPTGETRALLKGRWDVYWTGAYNFIDPPVLPKGTELKLSAYYNNGFDAAHGPDTRIPIRQGNGLDDELCKMTIQVIGAEAGSDSSAAAARTVISQ